MPGETPLHACVGTWFSWNGHVIYSRPWALLGVTCYIRSLLPLPCCPQLLSKGFTVKHNWVLME